MVGAEKLGTGGLVLDYAEYLESLAARSGGTEVIQNDRKNRDSFYYNKQVEQFLHRAIDEDLFEVYYQPVYSLHQQRFVTLEALSRLRHPTLGWISPDIFIRLAEKNHLISQITELQLRRVCRFLRENPRSARALRTSRSIFRRSISFTAMAEATLSAFWTNTDCRTPASSLRSPRRLRPSIPRA